MENTERCQLDRQQMRFNIARASTCLLAPFEGLDPSDETDLKAGVCGSAISLLLFLGSCEGPEATAHRPIG